ncbi:Bifunctional protein HldE, partial [Haemophilus influenzae]
CTQSECACVDRSKGN